MFSFPSYSQLETEVLSYLKENGPKNFRDSFPCPMTLVKDDLGGTYGIPKDVIAAKVEDDILYVIFRDTIDLNNDYIFEYNIDECDLWTELSADDCHLLLLYESIANAIENE